MTPPTPMSDEMIVRCAIGQRLSVIEAEAALAALARILAARQREAQTPTESDDAIVVAVGFEEAVASLVKDGSAKIVQRRVALTPPPAPPGLGEAKSWEVVDHLHKWFNETYAPWLAAYKARQPEARGGVEAASKDADARLVRHAIGHQLTPVVEESALAALNRILARLVAPAADESAIRDILWMRHGCPMAAFYGDDGEKQCGKCLIDFNREPLADIIAQLHTPHFVAPAKPASETSSPRFDMQEAIEREADETKEGR